jgi:hypothetical protein
MILVLDFKKDGFKNDPNLFGSFSGPKVSLKVIQV